MILTLKRHAAVRAQADALLQPKEDRTPLEINHRLVDELKRQSDKLGMAGFLKDSERKKFTTGCIVFAAVVALLSAIAFGPIGGFIGLYLSGGVIVYYLRFLTNRRYNQVHQFLPVTLQLLGLLVQSGYGLLPAIEKVVSSRKQMDPVTYTLAAVYELSASGFTFQEALKLVAQYSPYDGLGQTMLHLDLAGNEGGELTPALNKLTDHTQLQWKLSVEGRVRKLENAVVFPVFASVIGLMLLTAAGPVVPVIEFMKDFEKPAVEEVVAK